MASESCRSGTITEAVLSSSLMRTVSTCAGLRAFDETARVRVPLDHVDPFTVQLVVKPMFWIRMPRSPTHELRGSIPSCRAAATALLETLPPARST